MQVPSAIIVQRLIGLSTRTYFLPAHGADGVLLDPGLQTLRVENVLLGAGELTNGLAA